MKTFMSLIFAVLLFVESVGAGAIAYANTDVDDIPLITREEFEKYQKDEVISYDISYEEYLEVLEQDKYYYEQAHNNGDFKKVFEGPVEALSSITLYSGDVLITNATVARGLLGHAAIALNSKNILHIPGPDKKVDTPTVSQFKSNYSKGKIEVYRPKEAVWGYGAAVWAALTYEDSNAKYMITPNLESTDVTYCSKIVYQAYKHGAGRDSFNKIYYPELHRYLSDYDKKIGFIAPYGLPCSLKIDLKGEL